MMLHERLDAISASRVDGPSKLVLIMLAKRLDRDDPNGVVWSSSETLAEECGVSARAICHTMKRLTAAGIIRIVSKACEEMRNSKRLREVLRVRRVVCCPFTR